VYIQDDMVKLEKAFLDHDEYKFGVLYGTEGQSENEMFANSTLEPNTHTLESARTHA
jgi:hypothetical protein